MMNGGCGRRRFVGEASLGVAAFGAGPILVLGNPPAHESRQATGVRAGEATDSTAVVWVRLTKDAQRNHRGVKILGRANGKKPNELAKVEVPVEQLEGACPGAPGRVRVRCGTKPDLSDAVATAWVDVGESTDFCHRFQLRGLRAGTTHYYAAETAGPGGQPRHVPLFGQFETAPAADAPRNVRFCVMTCQGYQDRGHPDGHGIYPSMLALAPHFVCMTGDLVYYDNDEPRAVNARLARYHWERMFSLPRLREFARQVGAYWLKDDHDTLSNDAWPGRTMGDFTFAQGQAIFREQAPMADGPSYRTVRWGRDLQVWFTEGRDHRSPNDVPDGPQKTIWGAEQKSWFKATVKASDAAWKILVSPTPLVGPDRIRKNDNHANAGYQHEGNELRNWLKANAPDNFFVICGDRHWQYHSVHPQTGLHEFGVGAASDEHAGGSPGLDKSMHRFHRVKGGFLSVDVTRAGDASKIAFELRGVDGKLGYQWTGSRTVG